MTSHTRRIFESLIVDKPRDIYRATYPRAKRLVEAVEWISMSGTSVKTCYKALGVGFSPKYYLFLDLESKDHSKYILSNAPIRYVNGQSVHVLQDKMAVYAVFDKFSDQFPTLYGSIHDGRYYSRQEDEVADLEEAVDTYGSLVIKPVTGQEGRGVYKIEKGSPYFINAKRSTSNEVRNLQSTINEDYLVTQTVIQHVYARKIYPHSANSIRVLTAIDPKTGEPCVVRAVHRFGTSESVPTDNWENGGIAAPIDVEFGEIKSTAVLDNQFNRNPIDKHPESGEKISGVAVEMWDEVEELVKRGALLYPAARVIGWDIIVTADGPVILEASGRPGSHMLQLEKGLLEDEVMKRVLKGYEKVQF